MKKIVSIIILIAAALTTASAQPPQKFSYQIVIRNAANGFVTNANVGMRISILYGDSTNGVPVYEETQNALTNSNGLATIQIGAGTVISGSISGITWTYGTYFVKTETDTNGGTNYTLVAYKKLNSVPYAMAAPPTDTAGGDFYTQNIGYYMYPHPTVDGLNTVPIPVTNGAEDKKILRYNWNGTGQWELRKPVELYENITPGSVNLYNTNPYQGRITRGADDANLIPIAYGFYDVTNNTLSGNTSNVTVSKFGTGIFRITITQASIGPSGYPFQPVIIANTPDYGRVGAHRETANTVVVNTWQPISGNLLDRSFFFSIFNR